MRLAMLIVIYALVSTGSAQSMVLADFEEGPFWPLPGWTFIQGTTGGAISPSSAHDGTYGLSQYGTAWTANLGMNVGNPGDLLSMWGRFNFFTTNQSARIGFSATASGCFAVRFTSRDGIGGRSTIRLERNPQFAPTHPLGTPNPPEVLTGTTISAPWPGIGQDWFRLEIEFMGGGCVEARLFDVSGTHLVDSLSYCDAGIVPGGIAFHSDAGQLQVDSIEVRQASPAVTCELFARDDAMIGYVPLALATTSASSSFVDLLFEYTTNGGTSYAACTPAITSPLPNPAPAVAIGAAGFVWDAASDGVGSPVASTTRLRATVDDGVAAPLSCATHQLLVGAPDTGIPMTTVLEDFEEGPFWPLPGWSAFQGTDSSNICTSCAHDGAYGFYRGGTAWVRNLGVNIGEPGDILSTWARLDWGTGQELWLGFSATPTGCYSVRLGRSDGGAVGGCPTSGHTLRIQRNPQYAPTHPLGSPNPPIDLAASTLPYPWACLVVEPWVRLEVEFLGGGCVDARIYDTSGTMLAHSISACDAGIVPGGIALRSGSGLGYFDDIVLTRRSPGVSCTLTSPAIAASGDVAIELATASTTTPTVDVTHEFSTDGGASFVSCTAATSSAIPNPAMGVAIGNTEFLWDTAADGVGSPAAQTVVVRASVTNGIAGPLECSTREITVVGAGVGAPQTTILADFEEGPFWPLPGWTTMYGVDSSTITSGPYAHDGSYGLAHVSSGWHVNLARVIGDPGDVLSCWVQFTAGSPPVNAFAIGFSANPSGLFSLRVDRWGAPAGCAGIPNGATLRLERNPQYAPTHPLGSPNPSVLLAGQPAPSPWACFMIWDWMRLEVEFIGGGCVEGRLFDNSGKILVDSITACDPGIVPGGVALRQEGSVRTDTFTLTEIGQPGVLCGDCDLNSSSADILDALTASQIAVGIIIPNPQQQYACDVNGSGTIDVLDALRMAQSAVGISITLSCT